MESKFQVGIITMYYQNYNFGGMLQAYALQKALSAMGVDAKQLCYVFKNLDTKVDTNTNNLFKRLLYQLKNGLKHRIRDKMADRFLNFETFQQSIPHSMSVYTSENISESEKEFDAYICGGDQIWNNWGSGAANNSVKCFTLEFISGAKKKFSYAASVGSLEISEEHTKNLQFGITKLNAISVRETSSADFIKKLSHKDVSIVVDPVLLLTNEQWKDATCVYEVAVKAKYALCYFLGSDKRMRTAASRYCHNKGLQVVSFPHIACMNGDTITLSDIGFGDIKDNTSGPMGFVSLLENAELILTDSFHAIALSLIFKKNFYVFERTTQVAGKSMNNRIVDFLQEYKLDTRFVTPVLLSRNIPINDIDYTKATEILDVNRKKSFEYLKQNLKVF